jgi:hypothetical protein
MYFIMGNKAIDFFFDTNESELLSLASNNLQDLKQPLRGYY